jgi:hypothetical protein
MYRLSIALIYALTLVASHAALAQDGGAAFDKSKVPAQGSAAGDFVPVGWLLEGQASGDLNGDGVPDLALKLIQQKPAGAKGDEPLERQRALIVLFKGGDGTLRSAAVADKVLQCTSCGGAFYGVVEAPAEVRIERGVIVVNQEFGSRDVTEHTYRFRYEPAEAKFILIGFDSTSRDRLTAEVTLESTNFLTGRKITKTITPPKTRRGRDITKPATQAVPRKRTPMEEVDREDYY